MAGRQTDKYGNPAHHTGHLGAPGTTGAVDTSDPLGAPGSTGASPTTPTGYDAGGQEQLHRPAAGIGAAHQLPLHGTGTTDQGYAYATAASMGHAGQARVGVPHTTGGYETGTHATDRTGSAAHRVHRTGGHVEGYDTGSLGGGTDIGHTGGVGQRGHGDDKGRIGGIGQRGREGGGYDFGGGRSHEQGLGGQGVGGFDTGGGQTHDQGLEGHGVGGYNTGAGGTHGRDLGVGDWARSQGVKSQSDPHDTGTNRTGGQELEGHDPGRGGVAATVVEVEVSGEEALQEEEGKGIIDRILERLPGTGGETK